MKTLRAAFDGYDLFSVCGPATGAAFGLCSWGLYFRLVERPGPTAAFFLIAALAWGAAWKLARGGAAERTVQAFLASTLAVELLALAALFLSTFLACFLCATAAAALLCLCCGADEALRLFSFADGLAGAATLTLGAAAAASVQHYLVALRPDDKIALALAGGGCGLVAWGSVLYLARGLELGLTRGTEYALCAAAGFAAMVLLENAWAVVLVVLCTAAPAVLLAIFRSRSSLRKQRADAAMEGE